MKSLFVFMLTLVCILVKAQQREVSLLQHDWKFQKGGSVGAFAADFDDSGWQTVSVPHDWAISGPFIKNGNGDTGKLPWQDEGWYRKRFSVKATNSPKRYYLLFDGVMAFPKVYVNGQLAGTWDYGYNSFYLDVTEWIKPGAENLLAVHADTRPHESRWYPGGGIYRKVQLITVDPVHVDVWGTYITTPIVKPHYTDVRINTTLVNRTKGDVELTLEHQVLDADGTVVATQTGDGKVFAGKSRDLEVTVRISNPRKWSLESPHLYTLKTVVKSGGTVTDNYESSFGVRTIRFTANDGFYLNDQRVQLKGVNLHHDHGPLGAAFNLRAMQRQLEIMQSMGVNAVRNSHNTAAPELLELCDRMGILFFNEVFDKYDAKAGILDTTDFDAFAQRNIRNFVVRDRNHPSVFLWSVGNEIGDVQWNKDNGFHRLHTMLNYVDKYDPTRPKTLVCDNLASAELRHFDLYDVHSWNYDRRYRLARQLEPTKSVVISESASTVSTRGFYELPLPEKKTDFTRSLQVSSYDLNAPDWAEIADDDFMWQQDEPYIAGEFVWTGFDYLGEPTPYTNKVVKEMGFGDEAAARSSYFGIVDLVGLPKDRYYLYKSYWKPEETTIHVLPHWNWEGREGQNVPVFVYTNGDCAELFINGKSQGMRCKNPTSKISVERFRLMWKETIYQPGEVKVVAYKNGISVGERVLKTAGKPVKIAATADRAKIKAGGEDLTYITLEAFDKDGNPCPLAMEEMKVSVTGPLEIAGVGNGNPQSFEPFQSDRVKLFYGKAVVILKSTRAKGTASVNLTAPGYAGTKVTIAVE